jgi:hypothetical protein
MPKKPLLMMATLTLMFSCETGRELTRGHLETTVAGDHPDLVVGLARRAPIAAAARSPSSRHRRK